MEFGDIVYFKNIIFKNADGSHEIDPYFSTGRPCVYVGEYEDDMYFLPLCRQDNRRKEKFFDIVITPDKLNKLYKECKISYTTIIKKPSSFYNVKGRVNDKIIYQILKKSIILYSCEKFQYSNIVSKIMANYAIKENINFVKKKNKNDKIEETKLSAGDIVLLKQIIFSNREQINVDHAFNTGRPCVYVGEFNEKHYFFPLNSYKNKLRDYQLLIKSNKGNDIIKTGALSVNDLLETNDTTFQIRGNIGQKNVLHMFKLFVKYFYENYDNIIEKDKYENIYNIINEQIIIENNKKR